MLLARRVPGAGGIDELDAREVRIAGRARQLAHDLPAVRVGDEAGRSENTLRVERNAIHLPSGLIAGPTFRSPPRPCPSIDAPSDLVGRRRHRERRLVTPCESPRASRRTALRLDAESTRSIASIDVAGRRADVEHRAGSRRRRRCRRRTPRTPGPSDTGSISGCSGPDRAAVVATFLPVGRRPRRVAQPHRRVRIDRVRATDTPAMPSMNHSGSRSAPFCQAPALGPVVMSN